LPIQRVGWFWQREKIDRQETCKFDCQLVQTIFIFVVPYQFSQDICKWPENQILISDWTYFHCPGATLSKEGKKSKKSRLINKKSK